MNVLIPVTFNYPHSSPLALISFLCSYFVFYTSTWEEYHTGTLYLDYISGPSEGAWSIVICSLISFCAGPHFWDHQILGLQIKWFVPITFIIGGLSTSLTSIKRSYIAEKSKLTLFALLAQLIIPLVYVVSSLALAYLWIPQAPSLATWFIFLSGFPACFRISSTILAHLTKTPLPLFYTVELVPLFLVCGKFFVPAYFSSFIFKSSVILCSIIYFSTMILIIRDICTFLDINCLSIKHKNQ